MPVSEFDEHYFHQLEAARHHWWVEGMQSIGAAMLQEHRSGLQVLDAGCGSGALLPWLTRLAAPGRAHAVDVAPVAVTSCAGLGLSVDLVRASVAELPFGGSRFDLVVSMDVLQHLTNGQAAQAVAEMTRVLRPDGRLLVRTNAAFGRGGVSERDDWRLYRPDSLRQVLVSAGLTVDALTPVNFLQGLWASRPRRRSDHGGEGHHHGEGHHGLGIPRPVHPLQNRLLLAVLRAEARWVSRPGHRLPFGHSLYAVARKEFRASPGPPDTREQHTN